MCVFVAFLAAGNHPREHVGLDENDDRHNYRQADGPWQDQPEEVALLALKARRARTDGEVLRADHLTQHATRGVGPHGQDRADPYLLGRHLLQVGEEGVRGGIRARERYTQPPDERGEEREEETGGGKRQAQSIGLSRVVQEVRQPQYGGYRQYGPLELVQRLTVDPQSPARTYPEHD